MADPVRAYLRSIGDIRLITREREMEIAKRIVEGRRMILSALAGALVLYGSLYGGSLVFEYQFNVEPLDGSTAWDVTEKDQLRPALERATKAASEGAPAVIDALTDPDVMSDLMMNLGGLNVM